MKKSILAIVIVLASCSKSNESIRLDIATSMEKTLRSEMLEKWYPQAVDTAFGGFLSTFTYDFKPTGDQDKMIVTQARHMWTNAKASLLYPEVEHYKSSAKLGFEFLKNVMWDKEYGGFYWLVDRQGHVKDDSAKTAYGNSFGIYALPLTMLPPKTPAH